MFFVEIFGFLGFCSPYGMQKTGTKIPYGFKELAGNPVATVCACTGGERASAGKSDEKQRVTSVTYLLVRRIPC